MSETRDLAGGGEQRLESFLAPYRNPARRCRDIEPLPGYAPMAARQSSA